jgi:enamine deaminase RidA (YjgF/YER057c/UK114 family)
MAGEMINNRHAIKPNEFPWLDSSRYSFSLGMHTEKVTFLSGHTASRYISNKNIVSAEGTLEEQLKIVYSKIKSIYEASESKEILHFIEYITPAVSKDIALINKYRDKEIDSQESIHTRIMCNRLLRKEALIEIEIIYNNKLNQEDLIFLSKSGKGTQDLAVQTEYIYEQIEKDLKRLGLQWENVVNTTEFISKDVLHSYKDTGAIRKKFLTNPYPASTGIIMKELKNKDELIQVHFAVSKNNKQIINPYNQWHPSLTFSPAIQAGKFIFISGLAAFNYETGEILYPGDVEKQTEYIYKEMEKILQIANGSLKDVIRTVDYVVSDGLKNYAKTDKIRKNLLGSPYPTSTGIVCERLLRKGLMIEIEAMALLDN